jgi:UDP-3-O-[3-hydroxymyristoyl] glucosamine N-acyltransferase
MPFTAAEVAKYIQGEVIGDASTVLSGFAPADRAKAGDLTFAENETFLVVAENSAASAIIVGGSLSSSQKVVIRASDARVGFAKALELFFPEQHPPAGVHPSAIIASTANVHPTASIGPGCVVGENARIGARAVLYACDYIAAGSKLGDDVVLFPNVTLYPRTEIGNRVRIHAGSVIGSDGFGYVQDKGVHRKVPQIGNVIIGDDVEIGANCTIDRGALGATTIGRGTKLDNLVHVAHNVQVGEHCLLIAQVAIAGSTKLEDYVILAGQVGVAGHITLGKGVIVAAQSGVRGNIPPGTKLWGTPALPDMEMKRQIIALKQLHELIKRVGSLEKKLAEKDKQQ